MKAKEIVQSVLDKHNITEDLAQELVDALGLKTVWGYRQLASGIDTWDTEAMGQGWAKVHLSQKGGCLITREVMDWEEVGVWQEPDPEEDEGPQMTIAVEDFNERIKQAKIEALESAAKAYERESIGFEPGWGSNEIDIAKMDMLVRTQSWLEDRRDKYADVLPRRVNLNDTYRGFSDGAKIELDSVVYTYRIGFGDFLSEDKSRIRGNASSKRLVNLVDHNL